MPEAGKHHDARTPIAGSRAEILEAAIMRFAANGLDAVSLTDLAAEAGTDPVALEQMFGNTRELFQVAVREVARSEVARACRPLPPGPAVEQLRNFCGRGWEIMHTPLYAALDRLWVGEVPRHPELARFYVDEVYGTVHRMLVGIIQRGVAEGEFRQVAPHAVARVLMAALARQAFWCNHADVFGPALGGGCNRAVADTLSILLGGLQPARQTPTT